MSQLEDLYLKQVLVDMDRAVTGLQYAGNKRLARRGRELLKALQAEQAKRKEKAGG